MRRHTRPRPGRRAVSGLAVAGLLASLTAGIARADDTTTRGTSAEPIPVALTGPDRHGMATGQDYPADGEPSFSVGLRGPGEAEDGGTTTSLHDGEFTVTIDAGGLEGVADVELPCDADGLVATCTGWSVYPGEVYNKDWDVRLRAADGAEAGATGTLRITGEGDGLDFTGKTVEVRVGVPDFGMRTLTEPEGFEAGDVFQGRLGFRNTGEIAADRAVLRFSGSRGLSFPQRFSNCSYAVHSKDNLTRLRKVAVCTFDGPFAPGDAYRVATPVKVRTADFALRDIFGYRFSETAPDDFPGGYEQGDGPELTLEPATGGTYRNYAEVDLATGNTYDLDLTGERVDGAEGDTVTAEVALHNHGPAWFNSLRAGGNEPFAFSVGIPEGASVAQAPEDCGPLQQDGGSGVTYRCWTETPLLEQETRTFPFDLRIDEVVEGAKGLVTLGRTFPSEGAEANDDGWIVLNGTGDEETPGDSAGTGSDGPDDSDDGGTGGTGGNDGSDDDATAAGGTGSSGAGDQDGGADTDGGSLALTGTTAMTAGGAALALLAAGGALLLVRRRRAATATAADAAA
ncbi:hypothetical protein [Streptomyces sp. TR02-1]|uniref:hypothetical protein n=1 Tax=Streptomyces sp. TR02-1 TaxID=3385977 RepID=UPI0039A0F7B1